MISVCMASFNGERYIRQQIDSILQQLGGDDELVISDDGSCDGTADIIRSYADRRIRFFRNPGPHGVTHNFQHALRQAQGDILFLADQDDVWLPGKIERQVRFLAEGGYDVVSCNCALTDAELNVVQPRYYHGRWNPLRPWWCNFVKDAWLGCCMALRREAVLRTMPFPPRVATHDMWMALYAQRHLRCGFQDEVLQLYRRHDATASFAGGRSTNSLRYRISYRAYLLWHLLLRR